MPNSDSPYGGYILVNQDGSVVWQVAAREFPSDSDTDGTLEYAIRVIEAGRTIFASRDGKCLLNVNATGTSFNARTSTATSKFLIVSGYDAPPVQTNEILVGKSYYITGNSPTTGGQNRQQNSSIVVNLHAGPPVELPPYDLILRYDDYDLQRVGLLLDLEPDALRLCYQHWVSVRRIWKYYQAKPSQLAKVRGSHPDRVDQLIQRLDIEADALELLLIWSLTYHHLVKLGIPKGELDQIKAVDWKDEDDDIWLSRWRRVRTPLELVRFTDHPNEMTAAANWSAQAVDNIIPIEDKPLPEMAAVVDGCFGYRIEDADLAATDADEDISISGVPTLCEDRHEVKGSRTIAVTGLTRPGTFVLMWHGPVEQPGVVSHSH